MKGMDGMKGGILALAALLLAGPALALNEPDWPCQQRKVVRLSLGQMWGGPIPEDLQAWRADAEIVALAGRIAARRTPMAEVEAVVAQLAAGPDPDARLTALFAGAFDIIDRERTRLVDGIVRFSQKQQALAAKVDAQQVEIARLERETRPDDFDGLDRLEALQDQTLWDVRIYDERRRSLQYVCESPVLLEQRAFALGRLIAARLGG